MKYLKYGLFFNSLFFSLNLKAQQNHFIYIQTDNNKPFYLKLDKIVYSSTAFGYIIIPKLKTGSYALVIGFPKNEWPEQKVNCYISDKDLGYLFKNFGDRGWGLFNLQSLIVLMAEDSEKKAEGGTDFKSDAFSNMLSIVVNDSTIKQNEPVKEETKKPVVEVAKVEKPPVTVKPEKGKQVEIKKPVEEVAKVTEPPIILKPEKDKPVVKQKSLTAGDQEMLISKKLTKKTADGIEMVYVDAEGGNQDTVNIFIPVDKEVSESALNSTASAAIIKGSDTKPQETPTVSASMGEKKKDSKFLEIELPNPNNTIKETKEDTMVQQSIPKSTGTILDCKNFATNDDFLKLRKKMAAADNSEDMIGIAKKVFKSKCFTTEQVKNLSVLFLKDSGKYDFFDAIYPFVSDTQNFETLESQLTDSYYIKRFKVMIKN